jgi:hypothetical protein
MTRIIYFLLLGITMQGTAQNLKDLNDYQYALVPSRFLWQKQPNQHQVNTLTKMHLEKIGFKTFMDNDILPSDLALVSCNAITAEVVDDSNMLLTKVKVILRDCRNNVLFTSDEGSSREKEYKAAYRQALRAAFMSLEKMNYKYLGHGAGAVAATPGTETLAADTPRVYKAARLADGYKVMHGNTQVLRLFNTSNPDVFIASDDSRSGVLHKTEGQWRFEYYAEGRLSSDQMQIKF